MGSKQANEISSNNKESKAGSTGMTKKGKIIFSCVRSRKRVSKKRRKAQREKNGEREGNQHPWNNEKRSEQQE